MGPAVIGQTIAVVDRSGKVISSSKTLLSVLKDAKAAYLERKAEIVAERQTNTRPRQPHRALTEDTLVETRSLDSHGHKSNSKSRRRHSRDLPPQSPSRFERSLPPSPTEPTRGDDLSIRRKALTRRHTTHDDLQMQRHGMGPRSSSRQDDGHIDMDLAYGDLPPPMPVHANANQAELHGLMSKAKGLLDEAHCVQHSVTATITTLQKNPDALAAVALTLAEISNVVAKMAPGALTAMKTSFPGVVALLASPQFIIAAGVGVGVVIVGLGGYKIIKKIKARNAQEQTDELQEIGGDVRRIEAWRRGVSDVEGSDVASVVDGEFITPEAAALKRSTDEEKRGKKSSKGGKKAKSSRSSRTGKSSTREKPPKKPSPLQLLFR